MLADGDAIANAGPARFSSGRSRLMVIGNGPSLRGFDFASLDGVDTLGMNAAFRYWDRIDWRPTHYACLDEALIDTHHGEIRRLFEEGRIETFFLTARFLHHHPDLAAEPRLRFLDSFVGYWFEERGRGFGLGRIDDACFRSEDPGKITTGAYSVRYGAWLGYAEIGIIGVDLVYAPAVNSQSLDGIRLRMEETPVRNPNYFFDDYQRAGDEYHVANPQAHDGDLHAAAFRTLRNDFLRERVASDIRNCNPNSALVAEAILPYKPIEQFLNARKLSAVIVPLTQSEVGQAVANIWLWSQPAFFPFLRGGPKRAPALVFLFNNARAAAGQADIERALDAAPALKACFSAVRFVDLGLVGDADLYARDAAGRSASQGLRAGPNNMFFGGMAAVADRPGHSLWLETDCVPLRADWLGRIDDLLAAGEAPWVMGSIYRGADPLGRLESRHINGNAVYASGDPAFQTFIASTWRPMLRKLVRARPELAFDCFMEALFEASDPMDPDDAAWRVIRSSAHRFRYVDYIQNLVDGADGPVKAAQIEAVLRERPETYLIHSRRAAAAVQLLKEAGPRPEPPALLEVLKTMSTVENNTAGKSASAPRPGVAARYVKEFAQWILSALGRRIGLIAALVILAIAAITGSMITGLFSAADVLIVGGFLAAGILGLFAFIFLNARIDQAVKNATVSAIPLRMAVEAEEDGQEPSRPAS